MIILYNRPDRLGGNFISKLCQLIYAHFYKIPVINEHDYFNTDIEYVRLWDTKQYCLHSYFCKIFTYFCNKNKPQNDKKIDKFFNFDFKNSTEHHVKLSKIMIDVILETKQDILSYFHLNFKSCFYNFLKQNLDGKINIPINKYICYHIRLGDISKRKIIKKEENNIIVNYYIDKINNDTSIFDNKTTYFKNNFNVDYKKEHEFQSPINESEIINNINKVKKIYPDHDIYLVTDSPNLITENIKKYNYPIIKNSRNCDLDLWFLIHSDVLITSKSSFSLIAALLHQGKKIYFQQWGLLGSLGIKTKYDKTNGLINYCLL
jgi:hypothetical protein